jgi:hypothetical protein
MTLNVTNTLPVLFILKIVGHINKQTAENLMLEQKAHP